MTERDGAKKKRNFEMFSPDPETYSNRRNSTRLTTFIIVGRSDSASGWPIWVTHFTPLFWLRLPFFCAHFYACAQFKKMHDRA